MTNEELVQAVEEARRAVRVMNSTMDVHEARIAGIDLAEAFTKLDDADVFADLEHKAQSH